MTEVALVVPYTRLVPLSPPPSGWIWIQDVDQVYGVPHRTVYLWLRQGRLTRYRRLGDKRTYLDRAELERRLQLHPVPPKEEG